MVRNYIKLILVNCTQPIMISLDRHHISRFFFLILSLIFIPHHQIQFSAEYSINSRTRKFGHRQHHNLWILLITSTSSSSSSFPPSQLSLLMNHHFHVLPESHQHTLIYLQEFLTKSHTNSPSPPSYNVSTAHWA